MRHQYYIRLHLCIPVGLAEDNAGWFQVKGKVCSLFTSTTSFGFSVLGFVVVGHLACSVYESCKEAAETFTNFSLEILYLHTIQRGQREPRQELTTIVPVSWPQIHHLRLPQDPR